MDKRKSLPRTEMFRSRRLVTLLVAAVVIVAIYTLSKADNAPQSYQATLAAAYKSASQSISGAGHPPLPLSEWQWDATSDRNNHALTQEQCAIAFPDLYREIDRSRAYWKKRQGDAKLTDAQWGLEWSWDGGMRVMIWNGQLYVTESRGLNHFKHWEERSKATLHNLHRAIRGSREPIPNIEFAIKINDEIGLTDKHPNITVWNFSRNTSNVAMEQVWLIPDFNFWSYPRVAGAYGDFQRQAMDAGSYVSKRDKVVWRGTVEFNTQIRMALLQQSEGKKWSDIHGVKEDVQDEEARQWRITMPDHCKYKFAVHTEGTTWSGRLKYLLSCHSTILIHPLTFTTHLYHLLEPSGPTQNYVPVDIEWKQLPETMETLLNDPVKAQHIADNAAAKFRDQYFTPAAQTCYFRHLFHVWSEMTDEPNPWKFEDRGGGKKERVWRGITYEEYVYVFSFSALSQIDFRPLEYVPADVA